MEFQHYEDRNEIILETQDKKLVISANRLVQHVADR